MRSGCARVFDQPTTGLASLTRDYDNLLLPCTLGPGTYIARRIGSHILYVILFARPVHLNVLFFVLAAAPCCPFHLSRLGAFLFFEGPASACITSQHTPSSPV